VCYLLGDGRTVSIENAQAEQVEAFLWSSALMVEATDINVPAADQINSTGGDFPTLTAGRVFWFHDTIETGNSGVYRVVGTPTANDIQCTTLDGSSPAFTTHAGGTKMQLAPTRLLNAVESQNKQVSIRGGTIRTDGGAPIIWDGDTDQHILTVSPDELTASSGHIYCLGNSTVILLAGKYQLAGLTVEDGRLILMPGVELTAGTPAKQFWGTTGRIINYGALGANIDDGVLWRPGGITGMDDATVLESSPITVNGARATDNVQVFPGEDPQGLRVFGRVTADDTVVIRLENDPGSNVTFTAATNWHVRCFPAS
jgi:hypothetical protein